MHIEELKKLEKKGMELMNILKANDIEFTYDGGWGAYHIHDENETVCKDEKELKEYIESELGIFVIDEECSSCHNHLDEYCYSPTIHFKDGTQENIEDIITGMTRQDMINYENDVMNEYENVDYVDFGEFCPYCLSCM